MYSNADFVHFHDHGEFSRFDGLAKIDELTLTAKLMGFKALALTDHGNVGGWIKFYQSCKKKKYKIDALPDRSILKTTTAKYEIIKNEKGKDAEIEIDSPLKYILGCEFYLSRSHEIKGKEGQPDGKKGNRHLILIAKNEQGYKNLCTLSQHSFINGQYFDPRIDLNLLAEHSAGILCGSACLGSIINNNLLHDRYAQARQAATLLKDIFGENFYLETMYHGIEHEAAIIPDILKLGRELDIPVLATNDCHYCRKEQAQSQEVLMGMSTSRCIKDPKHMHFPYDEFYLKSHEEMAKIYGHFPEVLSNTVKMAERIEDCVKTSTMRLPRFDVKGARENIVLESDHEKGKKYLDGILTKTFSGLEEANNSDVNFETAYAFMVELVEKGMQKLGWHNSQKHIDRIKMELEDVRIAWESNKMDFATYFLIVWDYINFARSKGILTAPGRGSAFSSLILHCLGICYGVDPIATGLLFERFLGFDNLHFLADKDFGFDEVEKIEVDTEDTDDDLLEEVEVLDDESGAGRY